MIEVARDSGAMRPQESLTEPDIELRRLAEPIRLGGTPELDDSTGADTRVPVGTCQVRIHASLHGGQLPAALRPWLPTRISQPATASMIANVNPPIANRLVVRATDNSASNATVPATCDHGTIPYTTRLYTALPSR